MDVSLDIPVFFHMNIYNKMQHTHSIYIYILYMHIWMFPKIVVPPKSSIVIGFSIISPSILGVPPFLETPIYIHMYTSLYFGQTSWQHCDQQNLVFSEASNAHPPGSRSVSRRFFTGGTKMRPISTQMMVPGVIPGT